MKFAVLFGLGRAFGLEPGAGLLLAFALPQVGEFAFVLFSFAEQHGVLGPRGERSAGRGGGAVDGASRRCCCSSTNASARGSRRRDRPEREADAIHEDGAVIIAGFGSFGATVGRLLRASGVSTTVLDIDSDRVDLLRRIGLDVYYGDATRHDLLEIAGRGHGRGCW